MKNGILKRFKEVLLSGYVRKVAPTDVLSAALILILLFSISAFAQANLGKISVTRSLRWDCVETNATFRIYAILTNETNFTQIGTVSTNRWDGSATTNLVGWRKVYVTTVTEDGGESEPSETVLIEFRAGKPLPPANFQIFTFVSAVATNSVLTLGPTPPNPSP